MTAIIGKTEFGRSLLATDTRRHDTVTKESWTVRKLHRWSDQLLIAQGGAGTGAADQIREHLWTRAVELGPSIEAVEAEIAQVSADLIAPTVAKWRDRNLPMPPTYLVLASVDVETGSGIIRAIDLQSGRCVHASRAGKPYMAGSDTEAIIHAVSMKIHELLPSGNGSFPFDRAALRAIEDLRISHPGTIGPPVDMGCVKFDISSGRWTCSIRRGVRADDMIQEDYLATI